MSNVDVNFNGVNLSQWVTWTSIQRNVGGNNVNTMTKVGKSDGELLQYPSLEYKQITITGIVINNDYASVRKELGGALWTKDVARLTFSDDPSVYYMASLDTQATLDEQWWNGTVTIVFDVPDGVAHAVNAQTFTPDSDGNITVTNNGTYTAWPVITMTMHGDNGLAGAVNSNGGAIQFGDPEEADDVTGQRSDRSAWWGFNTAPANMTLNTGIVTPYPNRVNDTKYPNKPDGSYKYGDEVATPVWASNSANIWHGPALHGPIGKNYADSQTGDFEFAQRVNFHSNYKNMGRMEMTLESAGTPAFSAVLRDSSNHSSDRYFECWYNGELLKSILLPGDIGNYFLDIDINRHGDTISYRAAEIATIKDGKVSHIWDSAYWSTDQDGASQVPVDGLTLWCERNANNSANDMSWSDTRFTWINEKTITDIPNLFADGDVFVIDTKARKTYVNGVDKGWLTVGNDWDSFGLAPGQSVIQPIYSSWATAPDVSISLQEAYV